MNTQLLKNKFDRIGARATVRPLVRNRWRPANGPVVIDVGRNRHGEYFDLQADENADLEVLDVQFIKKDHKGWGPWIIGKQKEEQQRKEALRRKAKEKWRAEAAAKRKAAKEARLADKEGMAAGKLRLAKMLITSNPEAARRRLTEIIEKYPQTKAAKEAKELLRQLDEK